MNTRQYTPLIDGSDRHQSTHIDIFRGIAGNPTGQADNMEDL